MSFETVDLPVSTISATIAKPCETAIETGALKDTESLQSGVIDSALIKGKHEPKLEEAATEPFKMPSKEGEVEYETAESNKSAIKEVAANLVDSETVRETDSITETKTEPETNSETNAENSDLLTQLENKVSSFWNMASQTKLENQGEGLSELKQEILDQIASAKDSITQNESLQLNVQFAENKLKELTERVKTTDVGINFDTVSSQANKALDNLDSKLEVVEQQATKFVSLLTSFFSSMVVVNAPPKEEIKNPKESKESAADRSFNILSSSYGNSRFDSDLHKLHVTESFYLNSDLDDEKELASFDVNSKTNQISSLLESYPSTLQVSMNKLVPENLTYAVFWYRYFKREQQLKNQEEARKELLSGPKKSANTFKEDSKVGGAHEDEDDDDDFTWDDDEDETK